MTSPSQTQNINVWETSLEKRLRRLHLRKVSQTRRNARIVGRGVKCSEETRRRVRRLRPSRAAVLVALLQLLLETNGGRGMTFMTLAEIPFRVTRHREPQWRSLWGLRGLPVCSVQMLTRGKILSSFMKDRGYNSWWVFFCEGHILYQHIWPRQKEQPLVTSQGVICVPSCSRKLSMKSGASKHEWVKKPKKGLTDRTEIYSNYEIRTKFCMWCPLKSNQHVNTFIYLFYFAASLKWLQKRY